MTNPAPTPPALLALHQAIDEALLGLSSKLCTLRLDEEALDEAVLPPEFDAARREADAQRQTWQDQWRTMIAPALVGAGMEHDRIEELRRSFLRAIEGVTDERAWAQSERDHG